MSETFNLFDSIKTGLEEAIEFSKGNLKNVKVNHITISPLRKYNREDIKLMRTGKGMTQNIFAKALGVSVKTIEAWESGTSQPSGTASRLLELLERDSEIFERHTIVAWQEAKAI